MPGAGRLDLRASPIDRRERVAVAGRVVHVDELRLDQLEDVAQLGEVLAEPRIGGRDRRHRDADMHAGKRDEAVVDAVLGKDQDRPLGREPAVEECLGDGADLRVRLSESQRAPAAALGRASALGEEDAVRRFARPAFEPH
jgi:hypothetical protein